MSLLHLATPKSSFLVVLLGKEEQVARTSCSKGSLLVSRREHWGLYWRDLASGYLPHQVS